MTYTTIAIWSQRVVVRSMPVAQMRRLPVTAMLKASGMTMTVTSRRVIRATNGRAWGSFAAIAPMIGKANVGPNAPIAPRIWSNKNHGMSAANVPPPVGVTILPPQSLDSVSMNEPQRHRVVIVGGGFAGLYAARFLGRWRDVEVTLLDVRNFHLFQPLLYQVATGALAAGEIAQPLRSILRRARRTTVLLGEAVDLDPDAREVVLSDGGRLAYDSLVVATGARFSYFGHDDWAAAAPGLKSVDDALEIRRRILIAFEAAEREGDPSRRAEWMRFVIVGGGPTGAELAGALGEIANDTLRNDFRSIKPPDSHIVLVEAMDRILPTYPPDRSASAQRQLERLGVEVRTSTRVVSVDARSVRVEWDGKAETIHARTTLWAAGVLASSFGRRVAEVTGADCDRAGRVLVEPDLTIAGHPEIFVVGDAAVMAWKPDHPVPGVAQGGIQSGAYVAKTIVRRLRGKPTPPFRYSDHGDVAVLGRLSGVTNIPWMGPFGRQGGFIAWLLWLGIHITYLIGFANRIVVVTRWAFSFLTRGRASRLITGTPLLPPIDSPAPPASTEATEVTAGVTERARGGHEGPRGQRQGQRRLTPGGRGRRVRAPGAGAGVRVPGAVASPVAWDPPWPVPPGEPNDGGTGGRAIRRAPAGPADDRLPLVPRSRPTCGRSRMAPVTRDRPAMSVVRHAT